jgi:NhaB family Na+:H+ antiporter
VSSIAWVVGLTTCAVVESLGVLGYGAKMPLHVRQVLLEFTHEEYGKIHATEAAELIVQVRKTPPLTAAFPQ